MNVVQYFKTKEDFMNFRSINEKCLDVLSMFHFNPITVYDFQLFPHMETQYIYSVWDVKLPCKAYKFCFLLNISETKKLKEQLGDTVTFKYITYEPEYDSKEYKTEKVYIPKIVNYLSGWHYTHNVKEVIFPDNILSIESHFFSNCTLLAKVILPKYLTRLGLLCFEKCMSLKTLTIPKYVSSLNKLFSGNNNLEKLSLEGDTDIKHEFFENLVHLTSINFKRNGLTNMVIPSHCMSSQRSLGVSIHQFKHVGLDKVDIQILSQNIEFKKRVTFDPKVLVLFYKCFSECVFLKEIDIPSTIQTIENSCFSKCLYLSKVTLPDNLTSVGEMCFSGCKTLSSIKLPKNLQVLHQKTFYNCISLREIEIPERVKLIESNCFECCSNLSAIHFKGYFPKTNSDFYIMCKALQFMTKKKKQGKKYTISYSNSRLILNGKCPIENVVFKQGDEFCDESGDFNVQGDFVDGVIRKVDCIKPDSQRQKYKFKNLTIDECEMKSLVQKCFQFNENLERFVLGNGVKIISKKCFYRCKNLKSVEINGEIKEIQKCCFKNCEKLESVIIRKDIETIGRLCFVNCQLLKKFVCKNIKKCFVSSFENTQVDIERLKKKIGVLVKEEKKTYGTKYVKKETKYEQQNEREIPQKVKIQYELFIYK
ncbi:hypothetical protein EIN_386720 [Entamoeba invadens IP1]|uniref:Leucine rich repeat containing protein BspA family protein n=1 Tax=Entamoeba invadens IP1 TaxID=370355 RepID=A0A0A1UAA4_ENTIV|nr:hypothetical protein EIN_386720 [Entamoeba invadens IP1]ELP91988.1 hypothetical protein EIN_386720 [Entamoeba invadens IP1]|eukprot:XP_004258759.1 hypothetical protein EIN_386720 [Entamoeba invadens IP1]